MKDGYLKLDIFKCFTHYHTSIILLVLSIVLMWTHPSKGIDFQHSIRLTILTLASFIIAAISFLYQRNRLKFHSIKTSLSIYEIDEVIIKVKTQLKWVYVAESEDIFVAKTNVLSEIGGEKITTILNPREVLINSICDLDGEYRSPFFWRNQKHINTFQEEIRRQEQASKKTEFYVIRPFSYFGNAPYSFALPKSFPPLCYMMIPPPKVQAKKYNTTSSSQHRYLTSSFP